MSTFIHRPVLLAEVVTGLAPRRGGTYVDGTLGRAGHAAAVLAACGSATYVGIDRDPQALAESGAALRATQSVQEGAVTLALLHGRHGDLAALARAAGVTAADGILLDLGVSSPQLDDATRGFSFLQDGPLDMRMDPTCGETAADVVNTRDAAALAALFRTLGEEPQAGRLAKAIVRARTEEGAFRTTAQLAAFVERTVGRRGAHHPATRVFQALRMCVNDEVGELERALAGGFELLAPGGRFAVITFESITDRIVKQAFAAHAGRDVSLQGGGSAWQGTLPRCRTVTRKPVVATAEEISSNPRARSAKLRIAERI